MSGYLWRLFSWASVTAGFPLLAWVGYSTAADTFVLAKYGVAKEAQVLALEMTNGGPRNVTSYTYRLRIDGVETPIRFFDRLPVGSRVTVLTVPTRPGLMVVGDEQSTVFSIYEGVVGGRMLGILFPILLLMAVVGGPYAVRAMWRARGAWVLGHSANKSLERTRER